MELLLYWAIDLLGYRSIGLLIYWAIDLLAIDLFDPESTSHCEHSQCSPGTQALDERKS